MATPPATPRIAGKCGSLLYSVVREGAFVHVAMGTLVDDPRRSGRPLSSLSAPGIVVRDHGRPAPQYREHVTRDAEQAWVWSDRALLMFTISASNAVLNTNETMPCTVAVRRMIAVGDTVGSVEIRG